MTISLNHFQTSMLQLVETESKPETNVFVQVVGIEGHNPSGHCLIASKLVDFIPLPETADVDLHPTKKQALDKEIQSNGLSGPQAELSVVHNLSSLALDDSWLTYLLFAPVEFRIASVHF